MHSPIQFDQPGLVVLGCNIHDSMVGYIYVAETPFFGRTGETGRLALDDLPAGRYRLTLWSPTIADDSASLTRELKLDGSSAADVKFDLLKPLRAQPVPRPRPDGWESY
ncbi:MAG: hypothetical protein U1F35_09800 [Steroidobacteraceae bacterium]